MSDGDFDDDDDDDVNSEKNKNISVHSGDEDDDNNASATIDKTTLTEDDALQYHSVTQVTHLLRSVYLSNMFHKLSDYEHTDE